jgi:hypothetical protein
VQCGKFKKDGVELHVDHIIAKDNGGRATIENGQTLCASCNFTKKNYGQTESGKKMFIRFYELSKKIGDTHREEFPNKMLEFYDEYNVNGHIEWKK